MAFWSAFQSNGGGRPISLAQRATVYATALLGAMALVCLVAILATLVVVATESGRRGSAAYAAEFVNRIVERKLSLSEINPATLRPVYNWRSIDQTLFHDARGRLLARAGERESPTPMRAIQQALQTGRVQTIVQGGLVWSAAPLLVRGAPVGVVSVGISRWRVLANYFAALLPLLLAAAAFVVLAIPLAAMAVRRRAQPLEALVAFADRMTQQRMTGTSTDDRIDIRTGDEFETLASALNEMTTRQEKLQRQIARLAYVDRATQMKNHQWFQRELYEFLDRGSSTATSGAVIVFDLDRLRRLFETLGHEAADELLRAVAERVTHAIKRVDRVVRMQDSVEKPSVVARLRSQEFAVLAPSFRSEEDAMRFAQMATSAINQAFDWRELKLTLDCAAGAVIAPRDGRDPDTLTRNARLALASARQQGNCARFFTSSMDREAVSRLTLEKDMRLALEKGEFRAYFQPKIELATGRIVGAEALARWVRADKTIISPGVFVPAAEETGLIAQVGDAIMREACWNAAAWAREGFPIQVAVNVSPLQFRDERFPEHVIKILDEAAMPAFCLELEVTESVVMENPEQALRMIEPLRARGVRFAIDDFGCGHSSLASLSRLPFDVLKIDQQFVSGLQGDRHAPAIVETILAMAATLNMNVVAEGIEREKDAAFLRRRGCEYGQGFLYGAAEPAQDFGDRLRRERKSALSIEADVA